MKINGKTLLAPNIEVIVIPRGDGGDICFKAEAVLNSEEFEKLCPPPLPPVKMLPGGKKVTDLESPVHQKAVAEWGEKKFAWMIIQSLKATEGLEWDTVKMGDPDTYVLWQKELRDAFFSEIEITKIIQGVLAANCLDEDKIEAARKRFFIGVQEAQKESLTQVEGLNSTVSGKPASA